MLLFLKTLFHWLSCYPNKRILKLFEVILKCLVSRVQQYSMSLHVTYKFRTNVPDEGQRKMEGIKVKKKFPTKIPVRVWEN